jgi:hypothetical protein
VLCVCALRSLCVCALRSLCVCALRSLYEADVELLQEAWDHTVPREPPPYADKLDGGGGLIHQDVHHASCFQAELERLLPTGVCAVCSCSVPEIPNLHLLNAALPATEKLPRAGYTTFMFEGTRYCLQPLEIGPPRLPPLLCQVCVHKAGW